MRKRARGAQVSKEQGQAWSMDLAIGVVIFMLVVGILAALLISRQKQDVAPLRAQSEAIAMKLSSDPRLQVQRENVLDIQKLAELAASDYEELRADFGVHDEFCIYLEDEEGNLLYIINQTRNFTSIGSKDGDLNLSGQPCGYDVS